MVYNKYIARIMTTNKIERHKELFLIQNVKLRQLHGGDLIDTELKDMIYASGHGVCKNNTLDSVFSLVKLIKPKVCVVIGSGCGIIPRIIREAQIDSGSYDSKTYLVDLGSGMGAQPDLIHNKESLFRKLYPEIIVYKNYSYPDGLEYVKNKEEKIDILWIDGDHGYQGSKKDFHFYSQMVSDNGLIFMHDTAPMGINNIQPEWCGVNKTIEFIKEKYNGKYEVLNFTKTDNFDPGAGFAIIKKNLKTEV